MVRHGPSKSVHGGSNPLPAAMDKIPRAAVVDTFLAIHPDDESCHGPIMCVGCVLASEVRKLRAELAESESKFAKMFVYGGQLEAQIEDLKIDVKMHEREHQRVERVREVMKKHAEQNITDVPQHELEEALRA